MACMSSLLIALILAAVLPQAPQFGGLRPALSITCRPDALQVGAGPWQPSPNPISAALSKAGPGSHIQVMAGTYPPVRIGYKSNSKDTARIAGGVRGQPVRVTAIGEVILQPRGSSDTLSISQDVKNGFISFEGLTLFAGYRAAVMFTQGGGIHEGFSFIDCTINGGYDHAAQQGAASKWGVQAYQLKDFVFLGALREAQIVNIRDEHAFYLHNTQGDVLIQNVRASRIGRTFIQMTSRPHEGPPARGMIVLRDIKVIDACIARGDDYKGGTAFTFAGPHHGTILVQGCSVRSGFDPRISGFTRPGVPFGTSALVAYGTEAGTIDALLLRDNDFEFAPQAGDRALLTIGGVEQLRIAGTNRLFAGANEVALRLEPAPGDDPLRGKRMHPATRLRGRVDVGTRPATDAELQQLQVDPDAGG